ncbi:MAG TPA: hypothetical protein VN887_01315, partial [Candidatus Angelobacter sp.]|nr:hypothetical protein [Candidatus Angelobacter sp.]
MNSPGAAIAWEIWRKNRYGFLLLIIFFLVCVGLSQRARHYSALVEKFTAELPRAGTFMSREGTRPSDTRRGATRQDTARAIIPPPDLLLGGEIRYTAPPLPPTPPELGEAQLQANYWAEFATGWSGVLLGLSLLISLVVFALAESTALRGFSGVPSRLFTLPVRTGQLIAVPMAMGTSFVAMLYFAWSRLVFASLPSIFPTDAQMPDGYFLLLLPATLAWFQTFVWILPGFPKTRAALLIVLITAAAVLSGLPFGELSRWPERKAALIAIYAASLVMAPFVAWLGVARVRKGEWRDWPALTALMDRIANVFSRRRDFTSPASALFWVECRRNGRLALWGLAVVMAFIFGLNAIALLNGARTADLYGSVCGPILLFLVFIWTPVLGLMICGDCASRRLPVSAFQAALPVADGELAFSKLKAMVAVWMGGWLMAVLGVGLWAVANGELDAWLNNFLHEPGQEISLIAIGVLSLHVLFGLFPLWLTGRVPGLPWSFVVLLIAYAGLGNIIGWFDRHPNFRDAALLLIGFAGALKLSVAVVSFRLALKRKLVRRGFVFGSVSIWIVGTAFLVWLMPWNVDQHIWDA